MATKTKKINPTVASNITVGDNLQALAAKKAEEEKNKIFETLPKWEFVPVLPKFLILSESVNQDNFATTEGYVAIYSLDYGIEYNAKALKAFSLFTKLFDKGIMQSLVSKVNELIFANKTLEKSFYKNEALKVAIDETLNMSNTDTTDYDTLGLIKTYCYWYLLESEDFLLRLFERVRDYNLKIYSKVSKKAVEFGVEDILSLGIARLMKGSQELLIDSKFRKVCENNEEIYKSNNSVVGWIEYLTKIFPLLYPNENVNDLLNGLLAKEEDEQNKKDDSNNGGSGGGDSETTTSNWLLIGAIGILVLIFLIKKSRK